MRPLTQHLLIYNAPSKLSQICFGRVSIWVASINNKTKANWHLRNLRACVRLNPNYYPVYYRMGEIRLKQGDHIEALQAFETARKLNRKWEYRNTASVWSTLHKCETDRAREAFENLTHQKKKFAPAYIKLGQVLATQGLFR